jgi:hypothetical protein
VNPLDWGILGVGLLAFIFSFIDFYTVGPFSANAWHGFFGWFAVLLALAGSTLVAVDVFSSQTAMPMPTRLLGLGIYAVATLCIILALFVYPGSSFGVVGHGAGYWITLILIAAGLVLSFLRFQQTGGELPGRLSGLSGPGRPGIGGPGNPPGPGGPTGPGGYGQP